MYGFLFLISFATAGYMKQVLKKNLCTYPKTSYFLLHKDYLKSLVHASVDLYQFLFNKILPEGINNLLFLNVESLINDVSYGFISYVYDFIFIKLNLFSLTKIFRIVIINWCRIPIY